MIVVKIGLPLRHDAAACRRRGLLVAALAAGRWVATTALVTIGLIYAGPLEWSSFDSNFEDNGSREFMARRYRRIWAAETAGRRSLPAVPLALMLPAAVRTPVLRGGVIAAADRAPLVPHPRDALSADTASSAMMRISAPAAHCR